MFLYGGRGTGLGPRRVAVRLWAGPACLLGVLVTRAPQHRLYRDAGGTGPEVAPTCVYQQSGKSRECPRRECQGQKHSGTSQKQLSGVCDLCWFTFDPCLHIGLVHCYSSLAS